MVSGGGTEKESSYSVPREVFCSQVDKALKTGSPLPPPPKSHTPSDYVKCPHCERNFNASAAERHIPFCAEKSKNNKAPLRGPTGPSKGPMRVKAPAKVHRRQSTRNQRTDRLV